MPSAQTTIDLDPRSQWAPALLRMLAVAGLLAVCTACLEDFERLVTRVSYDPMTQQFTVERILHNVQPAFMGCADADGCAEAIGRALQLQPAPTAQMALSDRLLGRVLESGAQDVRVEVVLDEDRLDVVVTYTAAVGSLAAEDTLVHAEWDGKRNRYYLVIAAQDSMDPPPRFHVRKTAQSGASGVDWLDEWVLPHRERDVVTALTVQDGGPGMLSAVPGLRGALEARGVLGAGAAPNVARVARAVAPAADVERPVESTVAPGVPVVPDEPAVPDMSAVPDASVAATEAAVPPVAEIVQLDPESPARVYLYEPQVGQGLSAAAVQLATDAIEARIVRCYQQRVAADATVNGSAFLSALVRADGVALRTSVEGQLDDPPLDRCLTDVLSTWSFPAWGEGVAVVDVLVPVVFRVESAPAVGRARRGRR